MDKENFESERSGKLVKYSLEGETVTTFEPVDLPPEISYNQTTVKLIEDAASNLNELKGTGRNLPNPNVFIQPYLLKEAVLSSQIEGTQTSFEEAVAHAETSNSDDVKKRDIQEVINYRNALEYGRERLQYEPLTVDLIKRVHQKLMSNVRGEEKNPGSFRDKQVHIGDEGAPREDAEFVPMQPERIEENMEELVEFLNTDHSLPYLIKSGLIHYQFETIHPFEDGNGRVGRLLIILDMLNKDKLTQPLLYLSEYFNNNKMQYYNRLQNVREKGEYEEWINFYLRAVKNQSQKSTETAVKILDKRNNYREKLREDKAPEDCIKLMENMFDLETRTINEASEELDVSYHAARNYIQRLEEKNMIRETEKKGRNKTYVAGEILDTMEEQSADRIKVN